MKCDGQKPRCSHCISYDSECTHEAPSRTPAPKKRKVSAKGADDIDNTQGRLGRLGFLVNQIAKCQSAAIRIERLPQHELDATMPVVAAQSESRSATPKPLVLPPAEQVLPTIHIYLRDFNSVTPLFHEATLLRQVQDCYSVEPLQRDSVMWAAIHVVLALAWRHGLVANHKIPSAAACLSRAESVLPRVVLGNVELLNIQVLVGMVMLLQASEDLKPALILIATTMRLVHRIGLHDRAYSNHLSPVEAQQRASVFWLAYILDKNLSMLAKQPSIQVDDDINLDLPTPIVVRDDEDKNAIISKNGDTGVITTVDGNVVWNYFEARILLAMIQGGVYDYVYSTRSRKRSPEERKVALQSVNSALEQWKTSIPLAFSASSCPSTVTPATLPFLAALHATSLTCATLLNHAHAWDEKWIASIRRYGAEGIVPWLPPRWEALIGEAHDLLELLEGLHLDAAVFW